MNHGKMLNRRLHSWNFKPVPGMWWKISTECA
ncbi:MAG: hypothetical protein QW128_01095 [Thermoprotei archaeon]